MTKTAISNSALEAYLSQCEGVELARVAGDEYHYNLCIVSDCFVGKSKLHRQQWVYAHLKNYISTGALHALSMQTWSKDEWENRHG